LCASDGKSLKAAPHCGFARAKHADRMLGFRDEGLKSIE
jgi:hypothetical protein